MDDQTQAEAQRIAHEGRFQNVDIFGGDSDLSEEEDGADDDSDRAPSRSPSPALQKRPAPASDSGSDHEQEQQQPSDDDDEDDADVGGDGEYKDTDAQIKKLKIKKVKKPERTGEEEEPRRKKKRVKSSRTVEPEEEEEVLDPEAARRRDLNAKIEAIIKKPKNKSGRGRKRGADEDDLEVMNDEAVVRLRDSMFVAADQDLDDNDNGKFAVNKLRLLPRVVEMMQKSSLSESLVDNGVLEAVRRWLEPLHDNSLPAINIQKALFEILPNLSIETSALKSSGLGKIVYFYTKCKRVEPFIARTANQLVTDWMRPIIRRSKMFSDKDLMVEGDDYDDEDIGEDKQKKEREESIARRHARIPEMLTKAFKIAPKSDVNERGGERMSGPTGTGNKMRSYKKKLIAGQQASRRV